MRLYGVGPTDVNAILANPLSDPDVRQDTSTPAKMPVETLVVDRPSR